MSAGKIGLAMSRRLMPVVLACGLAFSSFVGAAGRSTPQEKSRAAPAPSDASQVQFTGEVLRGQIYEHDVGHDLVFRLTPATSDEGGGWVIGMWPTVEPPDEVIEFVEIATPPYHSYNERYLAAAAGYSAREAVQVTKRNFYFVQSLADQHIASEVVNAVLYPSAISEDDKTRIETESAGIYLGSGQLRILHSRINPGKAGSPDTIAWLRFEVVLDFSSNITLQSVLAPKPTPGR
jgi:hypothetical protein